MPMQKQIEKVEVLEWVAARCGDDHAVASKVLECLAPFRTANYVRPDEVIGLLRAIKAYRKRYVRTGRDVETQQKIIDTCVQLIRWLETREYPDTIYDWDLLLDGEPHEVELWQGDPLERPRNRPVFVCDHGSVRGLVAAAARRHGVRVSTWVKLVDGRPVYTIQSHR